MASPSRSTTHRLLYRGSLSLPDSDLSLDGLTFSAKINAEHNLLENPLALALESMRGRPTLRFMGVTSLKEIHMDDSGDIALDIHPDAVLSRIYFENMFCLPSTSEDTLGIRIALGDSADPDTTQIIVFPKSILDEYDSAGSLRVLSVARITPMPVIKSRLPRPDDPTPRKPPSALFGKALDLRRVASFNASSDLARVRQKVNGSIANLGSDVRLAHKHTPEGTFKIPSLPDKNARLNGSKAKEKDKGKGKATTLDDVFGSESLVAGSSGGAKRKAENKGKRKRESEGGTVDETLQETENKNVRVSSFRQSNHCLIPKTHPDFRDIYNYAYHGAAFALRSDMKTRPIEENLMERLVLNHLGMYTRQMPQVSYPDQPRQKLRP
ncbi:hypothetical protein F5876DRAFT_43957 [Lentinula aff. lateritia]|uniref:Uncharacterized protein n=1 Tax=Lentinula aff. lateritia TaxID=2804960 RepID=A0ACC1TXF4_9AGAR|nr:hypothetical protein F5876DRAFT_43957 [Lentinula aff. lateritia]